MVIVFTGGGTAGHISLNIALIPHFLKKGYEVHYIGSKNGMEKELISNILDVTYHSISTGKLRRYFNLNNFIDPFRIIKGINESKNIMKRIKPDIVFSKGGFVSFPVVYAANKLKIKSILHESDITPGLANKLSLRYCDQIFTTFDSLKLKGKERYIGAIVREDIRLGNRNLGLKYSGLLGVKPILLVVGGSSGARSINDAVRLHLDKILDKFDIIHICGKNNIDNSIKKTGYVQFEYVKDELKDLFIVSDIVISRAGANAIFELLSIKKPMLIVPLPASQSRGDQILNAKYFEEKGYASVISDENLNTDEFIEKIISTYDNKSKFYKTMLESKEIGSLEEMVKIVDEEARKK